MPTFKVGDIVKVKGLFGWVFYTIEDGSTVPLRLSNSRGYQFFLYPSEISPSTQEEYDAYTGSRQLPDDTPLFESLLFSSLQQQYQLPPQALDRGVLEIFSFRGSKPLLFSVKNNRFKVGDIVQYTGISWGAIRRGMVGKITKNESYCSSYEVDMCQPNLQRCSIAEEDLMRVSPPKAQAWNADHQLPEDEPLFESKENIQ